MRFSQNVVFKIKLFTGKAIIPRTEPSKAEAPPPPTLHFTHLDLNLYIHDPFSTAVPHLRCLLASDFRTSTAQRTRAARSGVCAQFRKTGRSHSSESLLPVTVLTVTSHFVGGEPPTLPLPLELPLPGPAIQGVRRFFGGLFSSCCNVGAAEVRHSTFLPARGLLQFGMCITELRRDNP